MRGGETLIPCVSICAASAPNLAWARRRNDVWARVAAANSGPNRLRNLEAALSESGSASALAAHIAGCEACRDTLERLEAAELAFASTGRLDEASVAVASAGRPRRRAHPCGRCGTILTVPGKLCDECRVTRLVELENRQAALAEPRPVKARWRRLTGG